MDCSLGCTPLSIDDWESFYEAQTDFISSKSERKIQSILEGDIFEGDREDEEDLCQE